MSCNSVYDDNDNNDNESNECTDCCRDKKNGEIVFCKLKENHVNEIIFQEDKRKTQYSVFELIRRIQVNFCHIAPKMVN